MKDIIIPTPEQADFYQDSLIDLILQRISENIQKRNFQIIPDENWSYYKVADQLNSRLEKFGWKLKSGWSGDKERGYSIWYLEPTIQKEHK